MAIGIDRTKIQSLVIFNEISDYYPFGGDIECRFYIDSDVICSEDKIGLFKIDWIDKKEFIVLKDIKSSQTDEFGEKKLIFPGSELPKDIDDQQYQFCYFHLFDTVYHLCGTSSAFRFLKPKSEQIITIQHNHNPTAPELPLYPTLKTDKDLNQTLPKRIYETTEKEIKESINIYSGYNNESSIDNKRSIEYELASKERELAELKSRYAQQDRIKSLQIESLNAKIKLTEERYSSLEQELKLKLESDDRTEIMQNDLMDTIKLTEAKNSSLEEQLLMRDEDVSVMEKKCSEQEEIIDELKSKLVITQKELDIYRTTQSKEIIGNDTENRFLREKIQELKSKYEKVKNTKEVLRTENIELEKNKTKALVESELLKENIQELRKRLDKAEDTKLKVTTELRAKEMLMKKHIDDMKSSYKSSNDIIIQARNVNSNITIFVNEMKSEIKDYAISHSSNALKSFNDIKSIAESIVSTFNDRFGKSWHCFIGENIAHNAVYHVLGTYIAFSIEDLKIIIYQTTETMECSDVLKSARSTKKVETIYKNEFVDSAFETLVASLALKSIDEQFVNYTELSGYITKVLHEQYSGKYGDSWFAATGALDCFDSNFLITNRRYIELRIESLKLIVLQIDEKTKTQPRLAKAKSLKV